MKSFDGHKQQSISDLNEEAKSQSLDCEEEKKEVSQGESSKIAASQVLTQPAPTQKGFSCGKFGVKSSEFMV